MPGSGLPTAPDSVVGFQPPPPRQPVLFNPVILLLIGHIGEPNINAAVQEGRKLLPDFMNKLNIHDGRGFLIFANDLLKWTPTENFEGKDIYDILCMFYFVLYQSPLKEQQTPIHPDQVGQPLSWLSSWIVVFAQLIGLHMDAPSSLTKESLQTFIDSPKYRVEEAFVPEGGFRTFNDFFSRRLKAFRRSVASPDDDKVIVYPADCTFDASTQDDSIVNISSGGIVKIKGLEWTIGSLLQGSDHANEFSGGVWMHAFLNTFNYHRQHAPVSGTVIESKNIQGAAYLEVDAEGKPIRVMNGPDAPNTPGYQFLQTRGLIVIENPVLGKVAVLPIGMAQVSSVRVLAREGDVVKKGDEISYFQFGGSDVICVFQQKARLQFKDFVPSPGDTYSKVGNVLAVAP
ncbi:Phosphatidylserine decarboxylase proenzyme 3 [Cladobotryum mycophilum]|uniref:Phosphatidylserine decarboxylase proenzyme 3 n=1 Tax=Cladobotryum mycophilum TaxID=491253 RepID=A0ABR0SBC9_9HYPO